MSVTDVGAPPAMATAEPAGFDGANAEPRAPRRRAMIPRRLGSRVVLVFVGLQVLFSAVVLLTYLVPESRVSDQLLVGYLQGLYMRTSQVTHNNNYAWGPTGAPVDRWTDCVALDDHLAAAPAGYGFVRQAFYDSGPLNCSDGLGVLFPIAVYGLHKPPPIPRGGEIRYWNGAAAVMRPVVAWGGVGGVRDITTILLTLSLLAAALALRRGAGWPALALLVPLVVCGGFVDLIQSMPDALAIVATLAGVALLAAKARTARDWRALVVPALVAGSVYQFIDMFTVAPGALAVTVGAAGVVLAAQGARRGLLFSGSVAVAVAWSVGWLGTWITKWVIDAALFGVRTVWNSVTQEALFRVSGSSSARYSVADAFSNTGGVWLSQPFISTKLLLSAGVILVGVLVLRALRHEPMVDRLILLAPAGIVALWAVVVVEHTAGQWFITWRDLPLGAGVVLAAVCASRRTSASPSPAPATALSGDVAPEPKSRRRPEADGGPPVERERVHQ